MQNTVQKTVFSQLMFAPKGSMLAVGTLLFALDYAISITYRPWWDIGCFTYAAVTAYVYVISSAFMNLTHLSSGLEFVVSLAMMMWKTIYLINYAIQQGNFAPFMCGAVFGIVFAGIPSLIEKWSTITSTVDTVYKVSNANTTLDNIMKFGTSFLANVANAAKDSKPTNRNAKVDVTITKTTSDLEDSDSEVSLDEIEQQIIDDDLG